VENILTVYNVLGFTQVLQAVSTYSP